MIVQPGLAISILAVIGLACAAMPADAAPRRGARTAAPAAAVAVLPGPEWNSWRAQYCEGWGPDGFGLMAGALPRYALNAFPDWHGECRIWGPHSSTSGTARW